MSPSPARELDHDSDSDDAVPAWWTTLVDDLLERDLIELSGPGDRAAVAHHFERVAELAQTDPDEAAQTVLEALEEDERVTEIYCDEEELAEAIRDALE